MKEKKVSVAKQKKSTPQAVLPVRILTAEGWKRRQLAKKLTESPSKSAVRHGPGVRKTS